jgi:hypothetical protein
MKLTQHPGAHEQFKKVVSPAPSSEMNRPLEVNSQSDSDPVSKSEAQAGEPRTYSQIQ